MLRQFLLFFTLLFSPLFFMACLAQVSISGKVVNDETGQPIAGASVYFNNTSIGTSSNSAGEFAFHSIDLLNTELIVSSVGYDILVFKLKGAADNGRHFIFRLRIKEEQLKEVLVLSDAQKRRWLDIFKRNFLGITEEASRSAILNEKDIYFTRGADKNTFNAYSDTPLVIMNRMLGYKVNFQLIEFSFNEYSGRTYFYGFTRYEELGDKKRWARNRRKAYLGSTLHFFRALLKDRLKEEGYDIYQVKDVEMKGAGSPMSMAVSTSAARIVSSDSVRVGYSSVTLDGKLMVQYRKDPSTKAFLRSKVMIQGNIPIGFRSFIVPVSKSFTVDTNGVLDNPLSVEFSGFWIYEKAANLLPYNYQPE